MFDVKVTLSGYKQIFHAFASSKSRFPGFSRLAEMHKNYSRMQFLVLLKNITQPF